MHFDVNPFHVLKQRGQKRLNSFRFDIFIGRFPSEGAASIAAEGLSVHHTAPAPRQDSMSERQLLVQLSSESL